MAPTARPALIILLCLLFNDLRKPVRPEVVIPNSRLVASGDVRPRSDPTPPRHPPHPTTSFVCGAGPLGSAAASAPCAQQRRRSPVIPSAGTRARSDCLLASIAPRPVLTRWANEPGSFYERPLDASSGFPRRSVLYDAEAPTSRLNAGLARNGSHIGSKRRSFTETSDGIDNRNLSRLTALSVSPTSVSTNA